MNEWLEFTGLNVPSSKNSKTWTGKILIKSKLCQRYIKWAEPLFKANKPLWESQIQKVEQLPIKVEFYFYRDSKRHWDFINILQIIADIMQAEGYLENDDTTHFIPYYTGEEVVKKDKAGFKMRIIE
jgi:hypothetical protein